MYAICSDLSNYAMEAEGFNEVKCLCHSFGVSIVTYIHITYIYEMQTSMYYMRIYCFLWFYLQKAAQASLVTIENINVVLPR